MKLIILSLYVSMIHASGDSEPLVSNEHFHSFRKGKEVPGNIASGVKMKDLFVSFMASTLSEAKVDALRYFYWLNDNYDNITDTVVLTRNLLLNGSSEGENCLKKLNNMTEDVLFIYSFNATNEMQPPLDLPAPVHPISPQTKDNPAKKILLDYPILIEHDYTVMRQYINQFHATFWKHYRDMYIRLNQEMRALYALRLVSFFKNEFTLIDAAAEKIRTKVSQETWSEFRRLKGKLESAHRDSGLSDRPSSSLSVPNFWLLDRFLADTMFTAMKDGMKPYFDDKQFSDSEQ